MSDLSRSKEDTKVREKKVKCWRLMAQHQNIKPCCSHQFVEATYVIFTDILELGKFIL